ncbi:MAG TPA: Hpt domain-containing protein, partial [Rhodocyclaceae bacterium]|nr:Hpt domain-containing protein [Rhodocyclaceae bacterium]
MSEFDGMEDVLQDFLVEASDLLAGVDNHLVELERSPDDRTLLNEIFRGFHTVKGGAGFLNASALVQLCHLTENLFDLLRNGKLQVTPTIMDVILSATAEVRRMFARLEARQQPLPADGAPIASLEQAIAGGPLVVVEATARPAEGGPAVHVEPDWAALLSAVNGQSTEVRVTGEAARAANEAAKAEHDAAYGRRTSDRPGNTAPSGRREGERVREATIRVDTTRLDHVLNLSGEIGLTKNRLTLLRSDILNGRTDPDTLHALDVAVGQLDLLVSDLQNAVMKTRMQPIGRLFQKYPRIARDLARNLGKEVELALSGEDTEIDKTMIEDLSDP